MIFSKKYFPLFVSVLFLVAGVVLTSPGIRVELVRWFNTSFALSLDEKFRSLGIFYFSTLLIFLGIFCLLIFLLRKNYVGDKTFHRLTLLSLLLLYFFHLAKNAVNFPVYDDQGAVLDFLLRYAALESASEKMQLLFTPYNECVMAVPRLFSLAWLGIFREINFSILAIFNGFLLVFFFWFLFRKNLNAFGGWWLLTAGLFFFQFQYFDDIYWIISGWCYYGVLLFALLSFHFLQSENKRVRPAALVCALLAVLTFGNGWLVFPVGIGFLFFQKRLREGVAWALCFLLILAVYTVNRHLFHPLAEMDFSLTDNLLFVLGFLGSSFQFFYTMHLPVLTGLFVVAVFAWATYRKLYRLAPVPYLMLLFLIGSAVMASPFRSGIESYGHYALRVRYGIFSITSVTLAVYLVTLSPHFSARSFRLIFFSALAYQVLTGFFFYPESGIRKEKAEVAVSELRKGIFELRYATFDQERYESLMRESIQKGIYRP